MIWVVKNSLISLSAIPSLVFHINRDTTWQVIHKKYVDFIVIFGFCWQDLEIPGPNKDPWRWSGMK